MGLPASEESMTLWRNINGQQPRNKEDGWQWVNFYHRMNILFIKIQYKKYI
jgi:hypothetical protein